MFLASYSFACSYSYDWAWLAVLLLTIATQHELAQWKWCNLFMWMQHLCFQPWSNKLTRKKVYSIYWRDIALLQNNPRSACSSSLDFQSTFQWWWSIDHHHISNIVVQVYFTSNSLIVHALNALCCWHCGELKLFIRYFVLIPCV